MSHPKIDQQITFIYTDNLELSAQFYEQVMGFSLWLDQGSCRIYSVTSNSLIGVCQASDTSKGRVSDHQHKNIILTLVTADVDGWYEFLKGHGVDLEHEPRQNDTYHIYHFFLRDPNGYLLEIQRFLNLQG